MKTFLIILGIIYGIGALITWYEVKHAILVPDDYEDF